MEHYINEQTISVFEDTMIQLEKSPATISKYLRDIRKFRDWLGEDAPVDKKTVIRYKQDLRGRYMLSSANSYLSALNTFFKILGWDECRVMTFKVQRESFRSRQKDLSREEYHRLLETAKKKGRTRLYYIMETIAGTGIRISELAFITVESLATRRALVSLKGKTREVLIPTELCRILRGYCRERGIRRGPIFTTRSGRPVDRCNVLHDMKELSEEAGVPREKIFPHNLRHLFAVTYYETEKDIVRLADLLGHANINTTRIYTRISYESQLSILDRVGKPLLVC